MEDDKPKEIAQQPKEIAQQTKEIAQQPKEIARESSVNKDKEMTPEDKLRTEP